MTDVEKMTGPNLPNTSRTCEQSKPMFNLGKLMQKDRKIHNVARTVHYLMIGRKENKTFEAG